jgi:hypothetical protein
MTLKRTCFRESAISSRLEASRPLVFGFLNRVRSIPFRMFASPPLIRDKNRMR